MTARKRSPGFRITGGKGFHITFENGYSISVQFGPGNYSDNHDMAIGAQDLEAGRIGSTTAEIAIIGLDGQLEKRPGGDTVEGYVSPERVAEVIAEVVSR
jgi:hypothetical protein